MHIFVPLLKADWWWMGDKEVWGIVERSEHGC